MFSYTDIRLGEIALSIMEEWASLEVPDEAMDQWHTVGDIFDYVVANADPPLISAEVFLRVQNLLVDGWGIPLNQIVSETKLFADGLMLQYCEFRHDWMARGNVVNWLAHAFLSKPDIECRLGNLLADHVRGRERDGMSESFQRGMRQHQLIDLFTDYHPVVHRSRARIGGDYRHLTGILIDIFYDHFLALDWEQYSAEPLDSFTSHFYSEIREHPIRLPEEAQFALERMLTDDRLGSYRTIEGIEAALVRVSMRLEARTGKKFQLGTAISELVANFDGLKDDFAEFFPALRAHVEKAVEKE